MYALNWEYVLGKVNGSEEAPLGIVGAISSTRDVVHRSAEGDIGKRSESAEGYERG